MDLLIEFAQSHGSELLKSDILRMTIAFTFAARLHRAWVKKDMAEHFSAITQSIDNVAATCSKALLLHSERLDHLSGRVGDLHDRVDKLEKTK